MSWVSTETVSILRALPPHLLFMVVAQGEGDTMKQGPGPLLLGQMRNTPCWIEGESQEKCLRPPWHWADRRETFSEDVSGLMEPEFSLSDAVSTRNFKLAVAPGNRQKQVQIFSEDMHIQPRPKELSEIMCQRKWACSQKGKKQGTRCKSQQI